MKIREKSKIIGLIRSFFLVEKFMGSTHFKSFFFPISLDFVWICLRCVDVYNNKLESQRNFDLQNQ